jgi:hypothetical protein
MPARSTSEVIVLILQHGELALCFWGALQRFRAIPPGKLSPEVTVPTYHHDVCDKPSAIVTYPGARHESFRRSGRRSLRSVIVTDHVEPQTELDFIAHGLSEKI